MFNGLALGLALALCAGSQAMERGVTDRGIQFVAGGVGETEQMALAEDSRAYTFWLTTAARGSGAYLANVQVRITDARTGQAVLDRTVDGPWLLVALPPGQYKLEATSRGDAGYPPQTQKASFITLPGAQKRMTLYFDELA
jgi:hypothetical protein